MFIFVNSFAFGDRITKRSKNTKVLLFFKGKNKKNSIAGNRTRVSWVKARYPNRWTTMD
ncbi:hypothetical protein MTR_1g083320 [Medicago truncatula]|uniref:Uncharacterized protein n=1 Tax=Medicago truncatula TaxID=3880 RepID=G7I8P6_MEDTR|nr:hypothetical protein MTR_1g083320 [Medicago truncatula]